MSAAPSPYHSTVRKTPSGRWGLTLINARGYGGAAEYDTMEAALAARTEMAAYLDSCLPPVRGSAADKQEAA